MKTKDISLFMMDSGNTDSKELIIDYMLSWTLRMAAECNDDTKQTVHNYCRKILSKIVFEDIDTLDRNYKSIQSVSTWKQWNRIDLLAEIILNDKEDNLSKHVLLIENKAYSSLHGDQLNRYKLLVESEYNGTEFENNLHYVYFTIKERDNIESDELLCKEAGFQSVTMDEIMECVWPLSEDMIPSGNEIFDEFWIKNWG